MRLIAKTQRQREFQPYPAKPNLIGLAKEVGLGWLERMGRFDRRRAKVREMNAFISDCVAMNIPAHETLDAVRTMLCANCNRLHPGLAALCAVQPETSPERLERCWLLKGSRCDISRRWLSAD